MAVQVAGSINVDLIQQVEALPRPGETVLALGTVRLPGGKGANQAVAAARMGSDTRMAGAVGDDEGGAWMRDLLAREGIDTTGIRVLEGMPSGLAVIAVDQAAENQIIVSPGANALLTETDAAPAADARILLAQFEIPLPVVRAFFTAPQTEGSLRILNAAPALTEARSLFEHVDILIVNQHELAHYLGLDASPDTSNAADAARALITHTDQAVIVTLGAEGAVAVWQDRSAYAPALPVSPIDTIGAGDCFCGALAALLDAGETLETALPLANAAAALCTLKQGAIPAMPTRSEAEAALLESQGE